MTRQQEIKHIRMRLRWLRQTQEAYIRYCLRHGERQEHMARVFKISQSRVSQIARARAR